MQNPMVTSLTHLLKKPPRKKQTFIMLIGTLLTLQSSQAPTAYYVSNKSLSLDLVGIHSPICSMMYTAAGKGAANACDFNFATYAQGQNPYPVVSNEIDRAFIVQFPVQVSIRSFFGDVNLAPGCKVDVFVVSDLSQVVRGDTRYLCRANIYAEGVYNCPVTMQGIYLVFLPLATEQPGNFVMRELRVWPRQELGSAGTVSFCGTGTWSSPDSTADYHGIYGESVPVFSPNNHIWFDSAGCYSVDFGITKLVDTVWVRIGDNAPLAPANPYFYISVQGTAATKPTSCRTDCAVKTFQQINGEEWYYQESAPVSTRHVAIGRVKSLTCFYETSGKWLVRKSAVFGPETCNVTPTCSMPAYSSILYSGSPVQIPWPVITCTPANCFDIKDLQFRDANNVDLVLDGTVVIDWVAKTITFQRATGVDQFITMNAVINSQTPLTMADETINFTFPFPTPCLTTVISNGVFPSATPYQINYNSGQSTVISFNMHTDSEGTANSNPVYCSCKTYTTNVPWAGVTAPSPCTSAQFNLWINTQDYLLAGPQAITLTIAFLDMGALVTKSEVVNVVLNHPCKVTSITSLQTIANQTYQIAFPTLVIPFVAFADTASTNYLVTDMCALTYTLQPAATAAANGISLVGMTTEVYSLDKTKHGQMISLYIEANASVPGVQDTPSMQVPFNVLFNDPCLTTTLTLPTLLAPLSCAALNVTPTTQTFSPATDTAATTQGTPGFCGPRIYSVVEVVPQAFVSIVPPAGDEYVSAWSLNCQSNSINDVGVYPVTIQATLQDYPLVPAATQSLTVTVLHPCVGAVIQPQTMTPADYQIQFSASQQIVLNFGLNTDSIATSMSAPLFCGNKVYSTNVSWAGVVAPADQATGTFQLWINTNDYLLAGPQSIQVTIGFADPSLTQTITQTLSVTLLHPCKMTLLTTSQTIADASFMFGSVAPLVLPFAPFDDLVSTQYAVPGLCGVVYSISSPTDASNYGVTANSAGLTISVTTTNYLLIGTTKQFILSAVSSTVQQNTPSDQIPFNLSISDPCPPTSITLSYSTLPNQLFTITNPPSLQSFGSGTDLISTSLLIPQLCGPIQYEILEGYSFMSISGDNTGGTISVSSTSMADVGVHTATFRAKLTNYPVVLPVDLTFTVTISQPPCDTTSLLDNGISDVIAKISKADLIDLTFEDSFAQQWNLATLCGPRIYTFTPTLPSFMSMTGASLIVDTNNVADTGTYIFDLSVTLQDWPAIPPFVTSLEVLVECEVFDIQAVISPPSISYTINVDSELIFLFMFTEFPSCGLTFTLEPQLGFAQVDQKASLLKVKTTDVKLAGKHDFKLVATPAIGNSKVVGVHAELIGMCVSTKVYPDPQLKDLEMFIQEQATLEKKIALNFEYDALKIHGVDCGKIGVKVVDIDKNQQPSWVTVKDQLLTINLKGISQKFSTVLRVEGFLQDYPYQRILQDFNVTLSTLEIVCATYPVQTLFLEHDSYEKSTLALEFANLTSTKPFVTAEFRPKWMNQLGVEQPWPKYVNFNPITHKFAINTNSTEAKQGEYRIGMTINYLEHPQVLTQCERRVSLKYINSTDNHTMTDEEKQAKIDKEVYEYRDTLEEFYDKQLKEQKQFNNSQHWVPPKRMEAKFLSIDSFGKAKVSFSRDIMIVPDLTYINNGTIYFDDVEFLDLIPRRLSSINAEWNSKVKKERIPVLQVNVIPGKQQDVENIQFDWNVTVERNRTMDIQIYFKTPEFVSATQTPDKLVVTFNDPLMFMSSEGIVLDNNFRNITRNLPVQYYPESITKHFVEISEQIGIASKYLFGTNYILNIFLSGSLSLLMSLLETQQLVVLYSLINIQLPANAQAFLAIIVQIVSFDFFNTNDMINKVLNIESKNPYDLKYADIGFESSYFINNMGTQALVFFILASLISISKIVLCCSQRKCCCKGIRKKIEEADFEIRNSMVGMVYENSAIVSLCCLIAFHNLKYDSFGQIIQSLAAILSFVSLGVMAVQLAWLFMFWKYINPNNHLKKYYNVFLSAYSDKVGRDISLWAVYFLVRRMIITLTIVFLHNFLTVQFEIMAFNVIYALILMESIKPFGDPSLHRKAMLNEVFTFCLMYHFMCFTSFLPDMSTKILMGYSFCFLEGINILSNLWHITFRTCQLAIFRFKIYWARRGMQKRMKQEKHISLKKSGKSHIERRISKAELQDSESEESSEVEQTDPVTQVISCIKQTDKSKPLSVIDEANEIDEILDKFEQEFEANQIKSETPSQAEELIKDETKKFAENQELDFFLDGFFGSRRNTSANPPHWYDEDQHERYAPSKRNQMQMREQQAVKIYDDSEDQINTVPMLVFRPPPPNLLPAMFNQPGQVDDEDPRNNDRRLFDNGLHNQRHTEMSPSNKKPKLRL